jgi:small-conductance mechanosensitive channel
MNPAQLIDPLLQWWRDTDGTTATSLRIVLILIGAWVLVALLQRAIRTFRVHLQQRMSDPESQKRAETLGRVFRYLAAVVVSLVAGMLVLSELGISVAPILGAAGVVGLAVGFGAQSLVKDYFTGFFLLLEDQVRTGDVVRLSAEHAGVVEEVTLRHVRLRDYEGNVHFVPAGQITSVINMTRGFSQAVLDIGVAYREDVDAVIALIREEAELLRADAEFGSLILEPLEMAGVDRWADSAVIIKCRFKVRPIQQWAVRREFLRRLKQAFDRQGIEIPFPHLTLYAGQPRDGEAPPLPVALQGEARPTGMARAAPG